MTLLQLKGPYSIECNMILDIYCLRVCIPALVTCFKDLLLTFSQDTKENHEIFLMVESSPVPNSRTYDSCFYTYRPIPNSDISGPN